MQISTAHSGLGAFVSLANPGKAKRGKKNRETAHTVERGEETEGWDSMGWIGEDLVL